MKSWGTRIVILYLGFVALIATMVFLSMKQNTDLVAKDYYAQELAYQSKLDKMNRSHSLSAPVSGKLENGKLMLQFPMEITAPLSGTAFLYCAADAQKDVTKQFQSSGNIIEVDVADIKKGQYQLQLDWESGGQTYFDEHPITVP